MTRTPSGLTDVFMEKNIKVRFVNDDMMKVIDS